jgi:hypothetical protein
LKTTTQKTGHVDSQSMASGSPEDVQVASEDDNVQGENGTLSSSDFFKKNCCIYVCIERLVT